MTPGLVKSQMYDRLDVSEEPVHQVITIRAGKIIRSFCNYLWCSYENITTDQEESEVNATEHESLNED